MAQATSNPTQINIGEIILVDDDPTFRTDLREVLEDEGFKVITLESASHALRYFQQQPWSWSPWVVLTDLVMDGMGGYEMMRRITQLYPKRNVPIIVLTRLASAEDRSEAEMAGASAFLTKPVEPSRLLTTIKKVTSPKPAAPEIKGDGYGRNSRA